MTVEIYQARTNINESRDILFMDYKDVIKKFSNLKNTYTKYYEKKYEYSEDYMDLTDREILGIIFEKFNLDCPDDFIGRSLSVSDIVTLNDKLYFCDSYGWKIIE